MKPHTLKKMTTWTVLFTYLAALGVPAVTQAAPGTLANVPLFTSAASKPNIMFLIDNSGSMSNIVPEAPYDPKVTYLKCPASHILANTAQVDVDTTSSGPQFSQPDISGKTYTLGTTTGTEGCFDPALQYSARLNATDTTTKKPGNYLPAEYSGNYLNWYFDAKSTTPTWTTEQQKPGTLSRLEIAKTAAKNLIDSLDNVRVGLSTYNNSSTDTTASYFQGAHIAEGVSDISAAKKTALKTKIDALTASGMTPLAESLQDIGRYFVEGFNNTLTLHPGQTNPTTKSAYTVFDHTPTYATGVTAASPIENFCQKNFVVILTDGRPQADQAISSTSGLQDYDGDCASGSCGSYDQQPGQTYESQGSDYLNDVAMALYDMDLRPDLNDASGNPVKNNIVTYTIGFADDQVINDPLMKSTAAQGGGLFIPASNADGLKTAFEQATSDIFAKTAGASAVAFNSSTLSTNSSVYHARFNTVNWSGELLAYTLDPNNGNIAPTPTWNAATEVNKQAPGDRTILTYNPTSKNGIPFRWSTTALSATQQNDLNMGPAAADAQGSARVDYLRGDRANEGKGLNFRTRSSSTVLGDIIYSNPVYVGKPELSYKDTAPFPSVAGQTYSDFRTANTGRAGIIYVGANDGMLHGFDAATGKEKIAYMPHNLFSASASKGLHYLTDKAYSHRYYVDLGPTVSDVYAITEPGGTIGWKTVLIGGERGGGRGLFALNVTDPTTFSELSTAPDSIVMWEFSNADDADLGYTFSKPSVILTNSTDGSGNYRWAVVFGNGYNDTGAGTAQLYVAYLDGGLDGVWTLGTDYFKITTKIGTTTDLNGLSTPTTVDVDGNGTADRVYAGDLKGNMWAFDLSSTTGGNWSVAYGTKSTPAPLFAAKNAAGTIQPITDKPAVVRHPSVKTSSSPSNLPNLLVLFGTGQYLVSSDQTNTDTQSFYGVWDKGATVARTDLVAQTFQTGFPADVRVPTDNSVDYATKAGWYIDLDSASAATGERVIATPKARGDYVFFNSLIPSSATCSHGGSSWLMSVKLINGGLPDKPAFDYNNDGLVNISDLVTKGTTKVSPGGQKIDAVAADSVFLGDLQYTADSEGKVNKRAINPGKKNNEGRLSWREVNR